MPRLVSARYACSLPVTARLTSRRYVASRSSAARRPSAMDSTRYESSTCVYLSADLAPVAGDPGASIQATTFAPDRSSPAAGAIASTVVVMLPVKKASTPALSSRNTVVQSRQPTGPYRRRYASASSPRTSASSTQNDTNSGRTCGWYGNGWRPS